jgi:OPA family glycerol-3-phosphate transporter-like MFS transporter
MAKSPEFYIRELTAYPVGGRRVWLLFIAILANFIASYEAQISPVVPLLLKELGMPLSQYGLIAAISVIAAAVSALIFGPLADRYGRVRFLIPSLFLTALSVYAMVFVKSAATLLIVRIVLAFIEGIAISTTAGLVRDFSPRMGRALAFGFWTFGPVGSNFFANALAGWTLPVFHAWQSQFIIQGTIAMISAIIVLFNVADLSPRLRARIITSTEQAALVNEEIKQTPTVHQQLKMGEITHVPRIWTLSIGISLFLIIYLTIQSFATVLLVQGFGYETSQAATIAKYFWLLNLLTLVVAGWISDRLRLRKIVTFIGAVLAVIYMMFFATLVGTDVSEGRMIIYTSLLGGLLGIAYAPWMAMYSENAEDIKAALQSAAWGLYGFVIRIVGVIVVLILPVVVEAAGWGAWMWIGAVTGALYVPLIFTARGPWFQKIDKNQINVYSQVNKS